MSLKEMGKFLGKKDFLDEIWFQVIKLFHMSVEESKFSSRTMYGYTECQKKKKRKHFARNWENISTIKLFTFGNTMDWFAWGCDS